MDTVTRFWRMPVALLVFLLISTVTRASSVYNESISRLETRYPQSVTAKELLRRAHVENSAEIYSRLAIYYDYGLGVPRSPAKSLLYHIFGAKLGSTDSALALSVKYEHGHGTPRSPKLAARFAREAARRVVLRGGCALTPPWKTTSLVNSAVEKTSSATLVRLHEYQAERGVPESMHLLGMIHLLGLHGESPQSVLALQLLERAARAGYIPSIATLGRLFAEGFLDTIPPISVDYTRAFKYFREGAEKDDGTSINGLGWLYMKRSMPELLQAELTTEIKGSNTPTEPSADLPEDVRMARTLFLKAVNLRNPEAMHNYALLQLHGLAPSWTPASPDALLGAAAAAGSILAHWRLGVSALVNAESALYQTDETFLRALSYFKIVISHGPWGAAEVRARYSYNAGLYRHALINYFALIQLGDRRAFSNAAHILDSGLVSAAQLGLMPMPDIGGPAVALTTLSVRINIHAAESGDKKAQLRLGDYYYYTARNYTRAFQWYVAAGRSRSNSEGLAQALFNVGYMYQYGLGTAKGKPDFSRAKLHYEAALERSRQVSGGDASYAVHAALVALNFHYWWSFYTSPEGRSYLFPAFTIPTIAGWKADTLLIILLGIIIFLLLLLRNVVANGGMAWRDEDI